MTPTMLYCSQEFISHRIVWYIGVSQGVREQFLFNDIAPSSDQSDVLKETENDKMDPVRVPALS
jgi:hypothetical protein